MIRVIFTIACALSLSICIASENEPFTALEFIEKTNLGRNIAPLSYKTATKSRTYARIVAEIGPDKASLLLKQHLLITVKKYRSKWNDNLAKAYSEHLSNDELQSLYYKKSQSKYADKMTAVRPKIGVSMRKNSTKLLREIVEEALAATYKNVK